MATEEYQPIFQNLDADDDAGLTEIESACLSCYKQGMTRLLMVKIPFFKEVVVSSFACEHCGNSNSGIDSASDIQEKGVKFTLTLHNVKDLSRQVVKGDVAVFAIPSLEFEQPPVQKKGEVTTIEGLISRAVDGLSALQPERRAVDPESAQKIDVFIQKLKNLLQVESPFQIVVDDPSGNSFIENFIAPKSDPNLKTEHYVRSKKQDEALGIMAHEEEEPTGELDPKSEVLTFPTNCSNCKKPCDTNMKVVDIPFFKEVVLMCTVCDHCGLKDNEVKGGAGIEDQGRKITLHVTDPSDLNRDILKSESCAVEIPEIELRLECGTLGGKFTTIEGLLINMKEQLSSSSGPYIGFVGDSSRQEQKAKMEAFLAKLEKIITGEMLDFHFIMDDPAGNSYMQNVYAPDPDPEMKVEYYERNEEQRDVLGLTHMKTENYTDDS